MGFELIVENLILCSYDSSLIILTFLFNNTRFSDSSQCRSPLALVKTEQRLEKNCKKLLGLEIFQFIHSPFFQLNCYFRGIE